MTPAPWALETVLESRRRGRKGINPDNLRRRLLRAGCPKGTVSKLVLIVRSVDAGLVELDDLTSLSISYELCKSVRQVVEGLDKPLPRALTRAGFAREKGGEEK